MKEQLGPRGKGTSAAMNGFIVVAQRVEGQLSMESLESPRLFSIDKQRTAYRMAGSVRDSNHFEELEQVGPTAGSAESAVLGCARAAGSHNQRHSSLAPPVVFVDIRAQERKETDAKNKSNPQTRIGKDCLPHVPSRMLLGRKKEARSGVEPESRLGDISNKGTLVEVQKPWA